MDHRDLEGEVIPNRAGRRDAARRARKLAALGSGAVLAGSAGGAVMSVFSATSAGATTSYTVNLLGDAGDGTCDATCTLRDAVGDASNDGDNSLITFAPSVTGTITLTQGEIPLGNGSDNGFDLTIQGPGSSVLTVANDGITVDRIFYAGSAFSGATVTMSGFTAANGSRSGDGGGMLVEGAGDLVLTNMVLNNNTTTNASHEGGAIHFYNSGNLTLTGTTISNNSTAGSSSEGGGIWFYESGNVTLTSSTITDNHTTGSSSEGGGLLMRSSGNLTVTGSTISNNTTSSGDGGGVNLYSSGDMTVTGSTVSGNTAGGIGGDGAGLRLYNDRDLSITSSTISGNTTNQDGGGVLFYQSRNMTVTNSHVYGNTSGRGAGLKLYNSANLTVTNSTITGNHASADGGGIQVYQGYNARRQPGGSTLTVTNTTVSDNTSGGAGAGIELTDNPPVSIATAMTVTGSTISGNAATLSGGGLYFDGDTLTVANSTIANNSSQNDGGGIGAVTGNISLLQSTISGNTAGPDPVDFGGGLYLNGPGPSVNSVGGSSTRDVKPGAQDDTTSEKPTKTKGPRASAAVGTLSVGTVDLVGTIVSGNHATDIDTQSTSTVNLTNSLWGTKGAGITINDLGGTINSNAPLLGALASNGGPTQTMALLTGSPAIDTGPTIVPTFPGNSFDQRGTGFPRVVNGRVDIGAYEKPLVVLFTG